MKLPQIILISTALSFTLGGLGHAQTQASQVLGSVNGVKIYVKQLDEWVKNAVANGAKDDSGLRQQLINEIVVREAVLQEVKRSGLAVKPENDFKIKVAQQNVLMDLWFAEYFKNHPISDADVKAEYDRQANLTKDGRNSNEYKVSQILVSSEKDAEDIINKLNSGSSFESLARDKSLDKTSAQNGGSVNWAFPDQLMSPIGDIVLTLSKSKFTQKPVKTQIGWHVIRLDDVRKYKIPPYDEAKQTLAQQMVQKKKQEAVEQLMKKTKVVQGK
jgi:peptidyl-prolyl cis-trans isomerase C